MDTNDTHPCLKRGVHISCNSPKLCHLENEAILQFGSPQTHFIEDGLSCSYADNSSHSLKSGYCQTGECVFNKTSPLSDLKMKEMQREYEKKILEYYSQAPLANTITRLNDVQDQIKLKAWRSTDEFESLMPNCR